MTELASAVTATVRRHPGWLGLGIYALGLAMLLLQSEELSLSLSEVSQLGAMRSALELMQRAASDGATSLTDKRAGHIYRSFSGLPEWLVFFNAWAYSHLGSLTGARLGQLLFNALMPLGLFWWLAPALGNRWALAGSLVPLLLPRWLCGAVQLDSACLVASAWTLLLGAQAQFGQARRVRSRVGWTVLAGTCFGFGLTFSWFAALVLPVLVATSARSYSSSRATLSLPSTALACVLLGPAWLMLLSPELLSGGPLRLADSWLHDLDAPATTLMFYGGPLQNAAWPWLYQADWLWTTTPVALLALSSVGFLLLVAWSIPAKHLSLPDVRRSLSASVGSSQPFIQAALLLLVVGLWPAVGPVKSSAFEARPELLLMPLAAFAVFGARVLAGLPNVPGVGWLQATAVPLLLLSVFGMRTGHVAYSWLRGGPAAATASQQHDPIDGRALQSIADQIGNDRLVYSQQLSKSWLQEMVAVGRAKWKVASKASQADLVLERLPSDAAAAAPSVSRGRLLLWAARPR